MPTRFWIALFGAAGASLGAYAQVPGQDAIDRNLQARAAEARALDLRLDGAPPAPRPLSPEEVKRSVTLPTPGTEILERRGTPSLPPRPRVARPGTPLPTDQQQLDESQRRRQLELQTQLPVAPVPATAGEEVVRQQALQVQQLQFEREQRAGQLGSDIMRNSDRAMRR